MTKIIGISGKMQAGKTTSGKFITALEMMAAGIIPSFDISEDGDIMIEAEGGHGVFDPTDQSIKSRQWLAKEVWPFVKIYNFADILKNDICIGLLGLSYESCYGTNEDKDKPTHIMWENMAGAVTQVFSYRIELINGDTIPTALPENQRSGPMSGRQVMEYVGSNIFRRSVPNVWVNALMRKINNEGSQLSVICDVRYGNEVEAIQGAGGKVIRLTRNLFPEKTHVSQTALDTYEGFDAVIDNSEMLMVEKNEAVYKQLMAWGLVNFKLGG